MIAIGLETLHRSTITILVEGGLNNTKPPIGYDCVAGLSMFYPRMGLGQSAPKFSAKVLSYIDLVARTGCLKGKGLTEGRRPEVTRSRDC